MSRWDLGKEQVGREREREGMQPWEMGGEGGGRGKWGEGRVLLWEMGGERWLWGKGRGREMVVGAGEMEG